LQNRVIFDLHCHSNQSDGILSPEALVSRAKERNVSVLALTDHDTCAGYDRAQCQAAIEDIKLISGIELSTQWRNRSVHIVGLNFDTKSSELLQLIDAQFARREERAHLIAKKLSGVGFDGVYEVARKYSGEGIIGRPHFAKALVEMGKVSSIDQAFKRYLGNGKVGDVKQLWPDMDECIEPIKKAGGIAVLAHPKKYPMTRTKLCELTEDFAEVGGEGIEVISGRQEQADVKDVAKIAIKYGLKGSCGSDFHAPGAPWSELGNMPTMPEGLETVWQSWA
jgi:hypothetical protein